MTLLTQEFWLELAYTRDGRDDQYNVPFEGEKSFDGCRVLMELEPAPGGKRFRVYLEPEGEVTLRRLTLMRLLDKTDRRPFYANGFQSWSGAREYLPYERMRPMRRPAYWLGLQNYGDEWFWPYPRHRGQFHSHGWTWFRETDGQIRFFGTLDDRAGYTILEADYRRNWFAIHKDCEGKILSSRWKALDVYSARGPEKKVMDDWFSLRSGRVEPGPLIAGWTSWYNYYTAINEEVLERTINALVESDAPISWFQIDDGWQRSIGDWLHLDPGFPSGMKHLADKARGAGLRPGRN